ncbi:flagellar rod assembly protein/muramidase FlgJ, partial [Vibrio harveyi]
SFLNWHIFC